MTDAQIAASTAQNEAASPDRSSWVSANAGSGKTFVLVNRVLRFLLSGTLPERILCLTFTKAAAAEMTNRVFERLSGWVTCPDAELQEQLATLLGRVPRSGELIASRRLFAIALETPGGLKIQTIHAFCESLLHRFPLEAGVPAGFDVLDETGQTEILNQCRRQVLDKAGQPDAATPLSEALKTIIAHVQQDGFDALLREVTNSRGKFLEFIRLHPTLAAAMDHIAKVLGLEPGDTEAALNAHIAGDDIFARALLTSAASRLAASSANDQKMATAIEQALSAKTLTDRADAYLRVFLKRDGDPKLRLTTKKVAESHPDVANFLEAEQARLLPLNQRLKAAKICRATEAFLSIAGEIVDRFAAAKNQRGMLDYDDLIQKTISLLSHSGAAWVLYKLDGGLDHILVDEAQDTSPDQWRVIQYLAEDFFAGDTARDIDRTIFAVGDEKQSIYSFQGADPAMFEAMRHYFAQRISHVDQAFSTVPLTVSFRSTDLILWAVDQVFTEGPARSGLTAADIVNVHQAVRVDQSSLIEIWPTEKPDDQNQTDPWDAPLDWESPSSARQRLADNIAEKISQWTDRRTGSTVNGRPIVPDDILILVRRRDRFVDALVRALKKRNIPVAGADRMRLSHQIAVMDLIGIANAALLPEDDLTLATVLKSPLIALSEEELYVLANGRNGSLWRELQHRAQTDERMRVARSRLIKWFNLADFGTPFQFFSEILSGDQGRRNLNARLGAEANDPIDEFLKLTLDFEQKHTPSLQGFLAWFATSNSEIKRDLAHGHGEVRIMTVHGAKGLEANIVILPDTCTKPSGRHDAPLLFLKDPDSPADAPELPVWPISRKYDVSAIESARAQAQSARDQEYHRLLYVAMTRACDWLIICGYETSQGRAAGCWYDLAHNALKGELVEILDGDGNPVCWRKQVNAIAEPVAQKMSSTTKSEAALPEWAQKPAIAEQPPAQFQAPSALAKPDRGGTVVPSNDRTPAWRTQTNDRFSRGLIIHKLLQWLPGLPAGERKNAAGRYLQHSGSLLTTGDIETIIGEVTDVLDNDAFGFLFGPNARTEVPIAGATGQYTQAGAPVLVAGQIDRLIFQEDEILVLDFKTDRNVPKAPNDVQKSYIAQLQAYRDVLQKIYPREIRCALLWTAAPVLMEIPDDLLAPGPGTPLDV